MAVSVRVLGDWLRRTIAVVDRIKEVNPMDISMSSKIKSSRRFRALAALAVTALVLAPASAWGESSDAAMARDGGVGVGSAFATILYAPLKVVYAAGGLVVGGLAYVFSGGDGEVARTVLTPSVLGDYVITPAHVRGETPIEFFGRGVEPEPAWATPAADTPSGWEEVAPTDVATAPEGW